MYQYRYHLDRDDAAKCADQADGELFEGHVDAPSGFKSIPDSSLNVRTALSYRSFQCLYCSESGR